MTLQNNETIATQGDGRQPETPEARPTIQLVTPLVRDTQCTPIDGLCGPMTGVCAPNLVEPPTCQPTHCVPSCMPNCNPATLPCSPKIRPCQPVESPPRPPRPN